MFNFVGNKRVMWIIAGVVRDSCEVLKTFLQRSMIIYYYNSGVITHIGNYVQLVRASCA